MIPHRPDAEPHPSSSSHPAVITTADKEFSLTRNGLRLRTNLREEPVLINEPPPPPPSAEITNTEVIQLQSEIDRQIEAKGTQVISNASSADAWNLAIVASSVTITVTAVVSFTLGYMLRDKVARSSPRRHGDS